MASSASLSSHYNLAAACQISDGILKNLTEPYAEQLVHTSTLSASFIMFVLTALFFNLNLFSGLSHVSAILDPKVRLGLTSALSLFLPVMSYLFSEAKNAGTDTDHDTGSKSELPLRARMILIWMLLLELLRNKVEDIKMQQGQQGGYSGTIERAGRVLWLGSLVFSNLQGTGRKATTGILWLLCATKLVQRIAFTEVGKRSLAFGKNAGLITSYMAQVLEKDQRGQRSVSEQGDQLFKSCRYAVMGEESLVVQAIPSGYSLRELHEDDAATNAATATVGRIWKLAEPPAGPLVSLDRDQRLRRLCLSFSLFKLLRRRFESQKLPAMTAAETRSYRELILRGTSTAEASFQVTSNELNFLCEYYHSVVPVVLASPFFFLANYFLVPLVVFVLCLVVIALCGNGDLVYAFRRIKSDNYFTFFGATHMVARCLPSFFTSSVVFFCTVDFSITLLLFLMFIYEEVWEFFVFLLSDWFLVSLLCKCSIKPHWQKSPAFRRSIRCLLFARSLMSRPCISFNQLCLLSFCGLAIPAQLPVTVPVLLPAAVPVPKEVKSSIMDYFTKLCHRDGSFTALTLAKGTSALAVPGHEDLLAFCEDTDGGGVAEVILTWHIATSLLEVQHPPPQPLQPGVVATSLSRYCAYLVAFHPELLPDGQDSAERVFSDVKEELYGILGFWGYYFSACRHTWYHKIMAAAAAAAAETNRRPETTGRRRRSYVVHKGAALGSKLAEKAERSGQESVWKLLAELWVELMVYIAPSSNDECVVGHQNVLAKGGEFITVLWAMATHAGISRPPPETPPMAVPIERVDGSTHGLAV